MSGTLSLGFATFFAVAALVLIALAFGTDHWLDTTINWEGTVPKTPERARIYYSRHIGLFRECFATPSNVSFLRNPDIRDSIVDGRCLLVEYEIPEKESHKLFSKDYWAMIHLQRSIVGFFIVAMVFILVGFIFGSVACWRSTSKPSQVAGIFVFFGAFFAAGAMAFFHGAEYIEKYKLSLGTSGNVAADPSYYYMLWADEIRNASTREYSWSYIVGWVGVGVAILAAILYLFTAWYIGDKKEEDKLYETYSIRSRSRPGGVYYDYVDGNPAIPAQYVQQQPVSYAYPPTVADDVVYVVDGKQNQPAYIGPLEYDQATGTLVKARPPPGSATWDYRS